MSSNPSSQTSVPLYCPNIIGLQPTNSCAELDSSTVFETNILRVSPVNSNTSQSSSQPSPSDLASLICKKQRIDKAFSCLTNKKVPGPDNISNNLIILSWPQLNTFFYDLFKDSLRLGFIPHPWNTSTAILLPNPGKKHILAQNWRTINLCSSLLKLLERTVLLHLKDELDINKSLNDTQLGFRKGRSTDEVIEALHQIVSFIEDTLSKGHFALTCFVE